MNNSLPKYFIFVNHFDENILKNNNTNLGVIYRNYSKKIDINEIYIIRKYCKKKGYKFYISNNFKLAVKCKADGLYIPSFNRKILHTKFYSSENFKIIGSAHNKKEINNKIKQDCKIIFLSPIFKIKKSKYYLGISKFNLLTLNQNIHFAALGGINKKNIKLLKMLNISAMAGINFYKKNRPNKLGRFYQYVI